MVNERGTLVRKSWRLARRVRHVASRHLALPGIELFSDARTIQTTHQTLPLQIFSLIIT